MANFGVQASGLEARYWSGDRSEIDALRHSMEAVRTGEEQEDENTKTILRLPDLEQSKSAVLNSLRSPSEGRSYDFANP